MRGDNSPRRRSSNHRSGSPPRAWGQCFFLYDSAPNFRFTPTCVGTMQGFPEERTLPPVHPHVRGDNGCGNPLPFLSTGSPPRAWGQYSFLLHGCFPSRFTPTCVGTMFFPTRAFCVYSVHPHVRGDNAPQGEDVPPVIGSPPRAWGQWSMRGSTSASTRFTPTCVGTIIVIVLIPPNIPVHPHVRGDNKFFTVTSAFCSGSPPRAWGQSKPPDRRPLRNRFTPTCVGTIPMRALSVLRITVHPHVRGDNTYVHARRAPEAGSPPRAWGQYLKKPLATVSLPGKGPRSPRSSGLSFPNCGPGSPAHCRCYGS